MNDPEVPRSNEDNNKEEPRATLEMLAVASADETVLDRWRLALDEWGYAFVAFTRLGLPELFTDELSEAFESLYGGTYDNLTEAAVQQIESLGWKEAFYRLRRDEGITDDLLEWNYPAVIERLGAVYEFVRAGGKVHFFAR